MRDDARHAAEPRVECLGITRRSHVVGDHVAIRTRWYIAQLDVLQQSHRAGNAVLQQLERDWSDETIDSLRRVGNHHETIRHRGHNLLARMRRATALDEPPIWRDLVGTIDRQIEAINLGSVLDDEAKRTRSSSMRGCQGRAENRIRTEPLGYWNALGIFSALGILLALGFASRAGSRLGRVTVPLALALYFTFSRGGWIGLEIGLVAVLALDPRRLHFLTSAVAVALASRCDSLTTPGSDLGAVAQSGGRVAFVGLVRNMALSENFRKAIAKNERDWSLWLDLASRARSW